MPNILLALKRRLLDEHYAKQLATIARDTGEPQPDRFQQKLPGDELALRGLPALGRGVSGEIRGTRPDRAIEHLDPSHDR